MTYDTKQKSSKNKDQIMPSKKKKYNARFPAGRIKKIMQTDEEVGKVAQAVPVIISRTLELFVESLLKKSMQITLSRNAKTLTPSHMKQCILSESRFDFLKDLVKDIPDASVQEDNENNAIFEESLNQTEVDTESSPLPQSVPVPSQSKRKQGSIDGGSRETPVHKVDRTGNSQPKKRKLPTSTEISSTSTSSNNSYPVPSGPQLLSPPAAAPTAAVSAANFYKELHQLQQPPPQQGTSSRTPVIQYGPKVTHQNHNSPIDGIMQASQLTFSVSNILNQNVSNAISSEEPNLRITIASEHLSPPPLAISTSNSVNAVSPRLAPSENVPPLVPFRMQDVSIAAPSMQVPPQKYVQAPGDLNIDEDYDN